MVHEEKITSGKKNITVDNESLQQLLMLGLVKEKGEKFTFEEKDEDVIRETITQ